MRFIFLLAALLAALLAGIFAFKNSSSFVSVQVRGPSIQGDHHGAFYKLIGHSEKSIEDGSSVLIWTTATFPGGPQGLAYAVIVRGLDREDGAGWSASRNGRTYSDQQGIKAEFNATGGGAEMSLSYAVDMVPPGPDGPRGAVESTERLLGSFSPGASLAPLDLESGRLFVVEISEDGASMEQFKVGLPAIEGDDIDENQLLSVISGE
jgi:hypothetical protein